MSVIGKISGHSGEMTLSPTQLQETSDLYDLEATLQQRFEEARMAYTIRTESLDDGGIKVVWAAKHRLETSIGEDEPDLIGSISGDGGGLTVSSDQLDLALNQLATKLWDEFGDQYSISHNPNDDGTSSIGWSR